jgi:hypothetical protein
MCTEPFANSTSAAGIRNILQSMYPITPTLLGPGTIIGLERIITKASGGYCWQCTPDEQLTAEVYDKEGFLVRTQSAAGRIELELSTGDGQIAVVTHA